MARVIQERSGEDEASLAGRLLREPERATAEDVKVLAASVLSQRRVPVEHHRIEAVQVDRQDGTPRILLSLPEQKSIALSIEPRFVRELVRQCADILLQ